MLIQHIYEICSLRRTLEEISMNVAYRWFIGYPLNKQVPHFSTVSYNFKHRFNTASVEYIFRWVLKAAADEGYCTQRGKAVFTFFGKQCLRLYKLDEQGDFRMTEISLCLLGEVLPPSP